LAVLMFTTVWFTVSCGEEIEENKNTITKDKTRTIAIPDRFEHCFDCEQTKLNSFGDNIVASGELASRWSKDWSYSYVIDGESSNISIGDGWVLPYRDDGGYHINHLIDCETGNITDTVDIHCNGSYNLADNNFVFSINPLCTTRIFSNLLMVVSGKTYFYDCETNKILSFDKNPGNYYRLSHDYIYHSDFLYGFQYRIHSRKLDNITESSYLGDFRNVFCFGDKVWLQDGLILREYDESNRTFEEEIDVSNIIKTNDTEEIELLGFDYFDNHILGIVHIPEEMTEENYISPHANNHPFPLTFTSQMFPYMNVKSYFLLNPEHPEDVVYLDEQILGSMDASVKVLGAHFIIENDKVLKCIDPFEQKDIWWINREDVGEQAKILWADERGVLVYSMTHKKLYCFE